MPDLEDRWETGEDAAQWPPDDDEYQGSPLHDAETCIICVARSEVAS